MITAPLLPAGVHLNHPEGLFIDGHWAAPADGGNLEIVCPNSEEVVARVAEAGESDMDAAVQAARRAFDHGPWPHLPIAERVRCLRAMAARLQERSEELLAAFIAQTGAIISVAPARAAYGTAIFATYAEIGARYEWVAEHPSSLPGHEARVIREPVGVVVGIAPWNLPYSIMAQKVAPALVAGCAVIMKPAPETPLEAYIIAEVAEEVGLPPGVLNLAPSRRAAADHLVCNPGVDKVAFTGSTAAGRRIAAVCGERIARVTLELGGKSPAIVLDDFPVAKAAKTLARTITFLTGQACATLSRAIVPAHKHEEFAAAIAAEMSRVKIGHSMDPTTEMGPLSLRRQLDRVQGYIAKGVEAGAQLVCGGGRPAHLERGFFMEPTLFAHVDNRSVLAQEEIFGPVLCLMPADDPEHAVSLANETSYGLNSAVFTHDARAAYDVARRIRSGNVGHNGFKLDSTLPFGGFKQSGLGRECGIEGVLPFVETKTIQLEKTQP